MNNENRAITEDLHYVKKVALSLKGLNALPVTIQKSENKLDIKPHLGLCTVPNIGAFRMVRVCILLSFMEAFTGVKFFTIY